MAHPAGHGGGSGVSDGAALEWSAAAPPGAL